MAAFDAKIEVDNASKLFQEGAVVAFRNVELGVRPNEVLCIVGPSGYGKTTLLRCIGGLLVPSAGRVLIDGQEVRAPRVRGHGDTGRVVEAPRRTDADPIRPPAASFHDQAERSAFHARPQDAQAFARAAGVR